MTEFISETITIPYGEQEIYNVLSNVNNLEEKIRDRIPENKVDDFTFDEDSCSFSFNPVGKVRFAIIERNAPNSLILNADPSPIKVQMLIQLNEETPGNTQLKLTVNADLNPFLKPMVSGPLQEGVNKIANFLSEIPYGETGEAEQEVQPEN